MVEGWKRLLIVRGTSLRTLVDGFLNNNFSIQFFKRFFLNS